MGNPQLILNFVLVLFLLHSVAAIGPDPVPLFKKFFLPSPAFGPDSIDFANNDTAYVGISDGRVLKFTVSTGTFVDFAFTAPGRNKAVCDGNVNPALAPTCGKVLGLSVNNFDQSVYLADANLGLFVVPLETGGQARRVVGNNNTAGGLPLALRLISGVDVDPKTGNVYFTDASQTFNYANFTPSAAGVPLDKTGRLLRYNPRNGQAKVLLSGLAFPVGVVVSSFGDYVLIPQLGAKNILRYFITGASNPPRVLLTLPGIPSQISRASGFLNFWVAVNQVVGPGQGQGQPGTIQPIAYRFHGLESGRVDITKDISPQYPNTAVTAIQETNISTVYVGSRGTNYITQYYH